MTGLGVDDGAPMEAQTLICDSATSSMNKTRRPALLTIGANIRDDPPPRTERHRSTLE